MCCPFGNEPTIEAYVWHSLLVLRELRRVLRDDGVLWWDLGDSYSQEDKWGGESGNRNQSAVDGGYDRERKRHGVPQGNLLGIPHRVMLAAQADGWMLRNDCVWSKVTAMPESLTGWRWERCKVKVKKGKYWKLQDDLEAAYSMRVGNGQHLAQWVDCPGCDKCANTDGLRLRFGSWRHTRAHEFILQMVKSSGYWSDGEIVKERTTGGAHSRGHSVNPKALNGDAGETKQNPSYSSATRHLVGTKNPRSVLQPAPSPYSGAHFAVFPPALLAPLILSSVPRRCCPHCGKGWAPVVEVVGTAEHRKHPKRADAPGAEVSESSTFRTGEIAAYRTSGYRPTCSCGAAPVPGIVLDPFCGSGTTGEVARECGVRFVGLDISLEYLSDHAMWRAELVHSLDLINKLPLFAGMK